ncbi:MAG TPA: YCF48-related protein, partial [Ignavibacteriaceae bacterium]|nr:YCF48-related protein [Ignavibacteriaceae bacterium]
VVGRPATILKTTDGGNTWVMKDPKLPQGGNRNGLLSVKFIDGLHGWTVGSYGIIRYTNDGGENWLPQYSNTIQDLYDITFPSSNFGWAVGWSGTVLKYSNETTIDWTVGLGISDAGGTDIAIQLAFGQNINATNGIDPSLGEEELPPIPQPGAFDVRFILPDPTIATWADFRNSAITKIDWIIKFQPSMAGYPITFSWEVNQLPAGLFYLKDAIDGSIINVNMRDQNSYTLTNEGINYLKIEFKKQVYSDIDLNAGWNMISAPLDVSDMSVNYLFPLATSNAFGFDNGYIVFDTLESGKGYWLRFANSDTVELIGIVSPDTSYVKSGWNMIGLFEFDLLTNQITTDPSGIIISSFFGFNNTYHTTTNLETGKGYWVKVNSDGKLVFNRLQKRTTTENYADAFENWGKIILQDKNGSSAILYSADKSADINFYEVPPLPPSGIFDVRFSSNRNAEMISSPKDIIITSAEYPVVLKVENVSLKVKDKIDGNRINKLLRSGEELIITDPAIKIIEVVGELIPDKFELAQNYPNPFNPSTTIRFALPVNSKVRISLYNILGELVADIVNREYEAGYQQVVFNGNGLASGVYIYRIEALPAGNKGGNFMDVKKMMMIK